MSILDNIVAAKRREVALQQELYPVKLLERSMYFESKCLSLKEYILRPDLHGIIAEFKRKSPSKGVINEFANPKEVCLGYMQSGASALSVLTDNPFFGGASADLMAARKYNFCPVLRKDFIISEYQVVEAKSIGADAILLIAEVLSGKELAALYALASGLGLEVLFEVHHRESIEKLPSDARVVGINNRNLGTFKVDVDNSVRLLNELPLGAVAVAESGIDSPQSYHDLRQAGFKGFLIGELFMRNANPAKALRGFVESIKSQGNGN